MFVFCTDVLHTRYCKELTCSIIFPLHYHRFKLVYSLSYRLSSTLMKMRKKYLYPVVPCRDDRSFSLLYQENGRYSWQWRYRHWYIDSNILKKSLLAYPLYEMGYVIHCVGSITKESSV
jgi:hypothetical protein